MLVFLSDFKIFGHLFHYAVWAVILQRFAMKFCADNIESFFYNLKLK